MNAPVLTIRSASSDRALIIGEPTGGCFPVRLTGYALASVAELWVESGDADSLASYFDELGRREVPWEGVHAWASLEGDSRFAATCSPCGRVLFRLSFAGLEGAPEQWCLEAGIETELAQLPRIAAEAAQLKSQRRA